MALRFTTITNSIAALSVSGVTITDIDEVPTSGDRVPIVIPLPDFITNFSMERDSYGGGSSAKMTVSYTLNYRLLFQRAGEGRADKLEWIDDLVTKIGLFMDAVMAVNDISGVEDLTPSANAITNMGLVNAPDDSAYYGCDFHLDCKEFVN